MSDGETLSREEIEKILQVTPGDTPAGLRNRALLVALFGDGRKVADIVGLTAYEAEWEDFAPGYRPEVDAWLATREELGLERFGPAFSSMKGDELTVSYVRGLVSRTRAKAAKLPDHPAAAEPEVPAPEPEPEPEPPAPEPEPPPPEPEPPPPEPEPPPPEPEPPAPEPEPPAPEPEPPAPEPPPPVPEPQPPAPEPEAPAPEPEAEPPAPEPEPPARETPTQAAVPVPPPPASVARPAPVAPSPVRPRPIPAAPPPRPPRHGFLGGRSPLAIGTILVGAVLLLGGGIAAAVALTQDSSNANASGSTHTNTVSTGSTSTETTTQATSTEQTSPTTTATTNTTPPPEAGTLAFVPGQSYCQLQAHNQLGFWITLQNTGTKDVDDIGVVALETYRGAQHANRKISGLTAPVNSGGRLHPQLQTVVSYPLPKGAKVSACSIRIFSASFKQSGKTLKIARR